MSSSRTLTSLRPARDGDHAGGPDRSPWNGVELRHLAALAAVARQGSFRGAAETLGYVQSAVSQQIAQLEKVVGHRLVDRERGHAHVALTEAGDLMLAHAEEIMARFGAAQVDLVALEDDSPRTLRVGSFESASIRLIPRILSALQRSAPEVSVKTTEADHCSELLDLVRQGDLDACFCRATQLDAAFASVRLLADPMELIVHAESELGRRAEPPESAELAGLELIEHRLMADLAPQLRAAGVFPRYGGRSERNAAIHALVAAGVGAAILPALAADHHTPCITVHSLDRLLSPSPVRLAWRRGRRLPEAFRTFLELARRTGDAVSAELTPPPCLAPAA